MPLIGFYATTYRNAKSLSGTSLSPEVFFPIGEVAPWGKMNFTNKSEGMKVLLCGIVIAFFYKIESNSAIDIGYVCDFSEMAVLGHNQWQIMYPKTPTPQAPTLLVLTMLGRGLVIAIDGYTRANEAIVLSPVYSLSRLVRLLREEEWW
ncbi:jg5892 [Pararge aegeria aegeria]|uniref:Jg5892 protein n=1 Tax=Pararge aegeria aegeria TaxID=348720 RepID=A0A8S4RGL3_9NEOP|nr:jg5892 [Pararge aegeria aegeria]